MSLIVEDGAGRSDAESYATVAAFKAYCDARSTTYGDDTAIEGQLRKATDYLGETYRMRWDGSRATTTQALDWPRFNVPRRDVAITAFYGTAEVPAEVVRACIELAIRAASGDLTPDQTQAIKREKVGALETEYQDHSQTTANYPAIDRLLAPLLKNSGVVRMRLG